MRQTMEQFDWLKNALQSMDEESVKIMAHNLKLLLIVMDNDLKLQYCNDIFLDMAGWSSDEILNKDYVEQFIPLDISFVVKTTLRDIMMKDTPSYSGTNKVLTRNKGVRFVNWNAIHLYSRQGKTLGMLCLGIDITEHHSLNRVLDRADIERSLVLDNISELVIYYDSDGRITWVNKAFLDTYSSEWKAVIGTFFDDIFRMETSKPHQTRKHLFPTETSESVRVQLPDDSWWIGSICAIEESGRYARQYIMILNPEPPETYPDTTPEANDGAYFPPIIHRLTPQRYEGIGIFSDAMKTVMQQTKLLHRDRKIPVLIEGETGTGKELVARYIHYGPQGVSLPFVDINCAAITPTIFESELFGYEGGSFTGSCSRGQKGKIELAQGGTLFLDEIGEIPIQIQAKLLRVIQEREYFRVGGINKNEADVRWICATNIDLEQSIQEGTFRKDLYYRIETFRLHVPPLRERQDDILPLAQMFLQIHSARKNKRFRKISSAAAKLLLQYPWPGNVRQLQNVIERVVLLSDDTEIQPDHLSYLFSNQNQDSPAQLTSSNTGLLNLPKDGLNLDELNQRILMDALRIHNGNKTKAASYLGLSRRAFTYRLKKLGMD